MRYYATIKHVIKDQQVVRTNAAGNGNGNKGRGVDLRLPPFRPNETYAAYSVTHKL